MFNYDKLEQLIANSGKTKTYLCKKMGKPAYYLRDVLKQKTAIPNELQNILADELGTTVEYLNDEVEVNAESERAKLLASLENMTKDELIDFVAKAMEVMKSK